MKTTEQMILEPTPVDGDARFQVAGRLLGIAWIVSLNRAEGKEERRDPMILREIAIVTARQGVDHALAWVEGWHYTAGSREHETWMTARRILGI